MTVREQMDVEALMEEIAGYLATVELFRAEGHQPRWRTDPVVPRPARAKNRRRET
jgi:hypothetical protein